MLFSLTKEDFLKRAKELGWNIKQQNIYGAYTFDGEEILLTPDTWIKYELKHIKLGAEHYSQLSDIINIISKTLLENKFLPFVLKKLNSFKDEEKATNFAYEYGLNHLFFCSSFSSKWYFYKTRLTLGYKNKGYSIAATEKEEMLKKKKAYLYGTEICTERGYTIPGEGKVPLSVIIDHYNVCEEDGAIHYGDECPVCAKKVKGLFKDYSYKVEDVLEPEKDKTILMGIELELEDRTLKNTLLTNKILDGYCATKKDGSLSNGIEIVTKPASISIHKKKFAPFFEQINVLKLKAKESCGMHVHVDKSELSQLQIGKINAFVYNNTAFIHKIAGRKANRYALLEEKRTVSYGLMFDNTEPTFYKSIKRSGGGKYQGINLEKPNTIEFRFFASTTKWDVFCKNIEFIQALVDYTAPGNTNLSLKDMMKIDNFISFVNGNNKMTFIHNDKNNYPNLVTFLKGIK